MMTATECPSAQQLRSLSLGQLSDEQSDELFDHVRTCDVCRAQLETVEDTGDSLVAALLAPDEERRFESEPDCRLAVAKALGALAHAGKSTSTDDLEDFQAALSDVARRHGIVDWEASRATYVGIGQGLAQANVRGNDLDRIERRLAGDDASRREALRAGYAAETH